MKAFRSKNRKHPQIDQHEQSDDTSPHISRLPTELLLQVLSYVQHERDLRQLALASRFLNHTLEPELWRIIEFNGTQYRFDGLRAPMATTEKLLALYRSLTIPRLGAYISIIRICLNYLKHCLHCKGTTQSNSQKKLNISLTSGCRCKRLDDDLGSALVELPNLQVLSLSCQLMPRGGMHDWLANLKTKELQELEIQCEYHLWSVEDFKRRLLVPCMSGLKALKFNVKFLSGENPLRPLIASTKEYFPVLDTFSCHVPESFALRDWFLSNRSIKRLVFCPATPYLTSWHGRLARILKRGPSRLDFLYVPGICHWLPQEDPSPYLNLTSLGTISIGKRTTERDLLSILKTLSFLKRLKMIELSLFGSSLPTDWSKDFFTMLETQNP
ncbi:hypothetical protein FRC17_008452, partial [Serendipita sp. 399]